MKSKLSALPKRTPAKLPTLPLTTLSQAHSIPALLVFLLFPGCAKFISHHRTFRYAHPSPRNAFPTDLCVTEGFPPWRHSLTTLSLRGEKKKPNSPSLFSFFFKKYDSYYEIIVKVHSHSQRTLSCRLPESENHKILEPKFHSHGIFIMSKLRVEDFRNCPF